MQHSLTPGQTSVLQAFYEFGPMTDLALAVYVHHVADSPMSSSGIRTRRAELVRMADENGNETPLLFAVGTKRLKSGRRAVIHDLTPDGRSTAVALFGPKIVPGSITAPRLTA